MDEVRVNAYQDRFFKDQISQADSITLETVHFRLCFLGKNIAENLVTFDLSNSLLALTKRHNGDEGLKDKLSNIRIFSDHIFNERSAGETLNDLFYYKNSGSGIEGLVEYINNSRSEYSDQSCSTGELTLFKRPAAASKHKFTFELNFDSGKKLITETYLIWK